VRNGLDRESRNQYDIVVVAKDNPDDPRFQKTTEVAVTIFIDDVNDNPPVFLQYDVKRVREDAGINSTIMEVKAVDRDAPNTDNSKLRYWLEDSSGLFNVSTTAPYIIYVQSDMKDHVGLYNVTVMAEDMGEPTLTGSTVVTISVEDVNLHQPAFNNLPSQNKIRIYEVHNSFINCEIIHIRRTINFVYFVDKVGQSTNYRFQRNAYQSSNIAYNLKST